MRVTGTCISYPINMGDQIGGAVWCSSSIIFGSYCDGDLWLGKVKYVPLDPVMEKWEAENHHHQVLQLEPLEVWHHRELVLILGSVVLLPVLVIPIIMVFISLVKLCIIFIYMVETLVIVFRGWSGWIFTRSSGLIQLVTNLIYCMGLTGFW